MRTLKQKLKQRIVATTVFLFMLFMMFGLLELPRTSATVTTTNLIQNFIAGSFGHQAMQNLVFSDITVGTASNTTANMTVTNVWDLRGSGAGWSVTGSCNNLSVSIVGVNNISNSVIAWNPAGGTLINVSGTTTGVTLGTAQYLNGSRLLVSSTTNNGMGNYRVNNVVLNVVYNGRTDQKTGTYQAILTMTSS